MSPKRVRHLPRGQRGKRKRLLSSARFGRREGLAKVCQPLILLNEPLVLNREVGLGMRYIVGEDSFIVGYTITRHVIAGYSRETIGGHLAGSMNVIFDTSLDGRRLFPWKTRYDHGNPI